MRGLAPWMALVLAGCTDRGPRVEPPSAPAPALHETTPASVSELCADASTRAWSVLAEGEAVAVTRGACVGLEARGWHLVSALYGVDDPSPDYELHLWLDDGGHPATAQMRTGIATAHYAWTPTSLSVQLHGDVHALPFDAPRHDIWVLPSHAMYLREAMLRLGVGAVEQGILQLGFVPEVGQVVPLPMVPDGRGDLVVGTAARFVMAPGTTRLGDLRVLEVLTGEQPAYRQRESPEPMGTMLPETPTPSYRPGDDLRITGLTIPERDAAPALAAELVIAGEPGAGRRPGVVFVSGSGPQDRHGFVPGTSIDMGSHEIHDALARAGFAVLRWDDRGVGESPLGNDVTPGFAAQVDDARRALEQLVKQPGVDPRRVVVIGHGEGALVASIVTAQRRKHVAAAVLIAPAARNARELIYWSLERSMAGEDPTRVGAAVQAARRLHEAALSGRELPAASEPMREWMVEIFEEDPLGRLRKLGVPVLALAGAKDFQTDASLDFAPVAALLASKGREGSASQLFPELDHLLKPEPGVSTVGHYGDLTRSVDEQALQTLVAWCRARVGA